MQFSPLQFTSILVNGGCTMFATLALHHCVALGHCACLLLRLGVFFVEYINTWLIQGLTRSCVQVNCHFFHLPVGDLQFQAVWCDSYVWDWLTFLRAEHLSVLNNPVALYAALGWVQTFIFYKSCVVKWTDLTPILAARFSRWAKFGPVSSVVVLLFLKWPCRTAWTKGSSRSQHSDAHPSLRTLKWLRTLKHPL